ncbi:hypothetical protein L6E10_35490 [Lentzea sp. CC55]|nr:hypothetical protein [Lentzea sp. CC55]MCG8927705.1 hypothetical protein [Lentzea sp. CC55]
MRWNSTARRDTDDFRATSSFEESAATRLASLEYRRASSSSLVLISELMATIIRCGSRMNDTAPADNAASAASRDVVRSSPRLLGSSATSAAGDAEREAQLGGELRRRSARPGYGLAQRFTRVLMAPVEAERPEQQRGDVEEEPATAWRTVSAPCATSAPNPLLDPANRPRSSGTTCTANTEDSISTRPSTGGGADRS